MNFPEKILQEKSLPAAFYTLGCDSSRSTDKKCELNLKAHIRLVQTSTNAICMYSQCLGIKCIILYEFLTPKLPIIA